MITQFRPMLAYGLCEEDLKSLKFPLILQPKLDGVRCCIVEGKALSRKLKRIPNRYIRTKLEAFKNKPPVLIDGELVIQGKTFNEIQSAIMSEDGEPNFRYIIFDALNEWSNESYIHRKQFLDYSLEYTNNLFFVSDVTLDQYEKLDEWEQYILKDGHEGIILRDPFSPYKFGRSTLREQSLLKFKRFNDSEAVIISSNELMTNSNILETDELGYAKRSSAAANLIRTCQLGSWTVKDININSRFYNVEFNVGSGFTLEQRIKFWNTKQDGKIITYKYQAHGSKDKPRSPIWLGFRKDI